VSEHVGKILWHVHEPAGIGCKLDEELDHQGGKKNKTASTTDLRNELGEVVELELKGSIFGITSKSWEFGSAAFGVGFCKELTHHDAAVETLRTDGDNDILTNTFQDLGTGDNERVLPSLFVDLVVFESFGRSDLLDRVRLASGARFVTSDIVTSNQNTITRDDFTRFQKREVTDKDVLQKNFNLQKS